MEVFCLSTAVNKRLDLMRQHATEWKETFAFEIENRRDLGKQHCQQQSQLRLEKRDYRKQVAMVMGQLDELRVLRGEMQRKRESINQRQADERNRLNSDRLSTSFYG